MLDIFFIVVFRYMYVSLYMYANTVNRQLGELAIL